MSLYSMSDLSLVTSLSVDMQVGYLINYLIIQKQKKVL